MDCPQCGFPLWELKTKSCPKCGKLVSSIQVNRTHQVDIAHHGEDWEAARKKLDAALDLCRRNRYRALRVIHGRGTAAGHTGILKVRTVEYLLKRIKRFRGTLESDSKNPGVHTVYFNVK